MIDVSLRSGHGGHPAFGQSKAHVELSAVSAPRRLTGTRGFRRLMQVTPSVVGSKSTSTRSTRGRARRRDRSNHDGRSPSRSGVIDMSRRCPSGARQSPDGGAIGDCGTGCVSLRSAHGGHPAFKPSKAHAQRSAVSAAATDGHPRLSQAHASHSHLRRLEVDNRPPHQREPPQRRPPKPREPPQRRPPKPREPPQRRPPNHGSRRSGDRPNHAAPRVTTRAGARRVRPAPCTAGCSRGGAPAGRCGGGAVRRRTCPARRGAGRGAPWHRPRTCRAWRRART